MNSEVSILKNTASGELLARYLLTCDALFQPELSTQVVIADYAQKLIDHAERFEAWSGGDLIGLVAAYINDPSRRAAYITSVSILAPWQRTGLASKLLTLCLREVQEAAFSSIQLEVASTNASAISLYERHGFSIRKHNCDRLTMVTSFEQSTRND